MARHDLMVLLRDVYRFAGESPLAGFLAYYGSLTSSIRRIVDQVKDYRATRNTRNRVRAEFLIRRLVS